MFSNYLELILGLVVIFALLSVLVSLLNELYRNFTRDRGKMMYAYVRKMLADEHNLDITYLIFRHPLIDNSRKNDAHRPAFIEPKIFATAFIQTIGDLSTDVTYTHNSDGVYTPVETRDADPLRRFHASVNKMNAGPLKRTLLGMAERAGLDPKDQYLALENEIIEWFNFQMKILTGEYQNKQRKSLLFFGFAITLFLNVDSLHLVHELRNDPALRTELNAKAQSISEEYKGVVEELKKADEYGFSGNDEALMNKALTITSELKAVNNKIENMELPVGYSRNSAPLSWFCRDKNLETAYEIRRNKPTFMGVVFYVLGIIISGFSLSLGAPFWFDVLNKLVNLKRGGK
jgi:hypothetical protein